MASLEDDITRGRNSLLEHFGSREAALGVQIIQMSQSEQPCDVTFYERPSILGVKIRPSIGAAAMYGAGAERMAKLLSSIDGTRKSGSVLCDVQIPDGLFRREVAVNVGRSMLRRFQRIGETLEDEVVHDRLLMTY